MKPLGLYIRQSPRMACALAFGSVTMAVTHLAWSPDARLSHLALTFAAGLAHALAGAITGPRLVDATRTRTAAQAGLLGAGTSLLALVLFSSWFAVFLFTTDIHPAGRFSYVALPLLIGLFAFLGAGWALLGVSIGVAWVLYWVAASPGAA